MPKVTDPSRRLLLAVTHPMTARWLMCGQLRFLREAGFEVLLVSSPGPDLDRVAEREGVETAAVPFSREISPLRDLAALFRLIGVIRRFRPRIVNGGTPKAGLLSMLAARLCGVPVRIYTVRGLRLATTTGLRRALLRGTERVASRCACRLVFVGPSLRDEYLSLDLADPDKAVVLASGSSNGVDVERFRPRDRDDPELRTYRQETGLTEDGPVLGFVGRLTRDKGIEDLVDAYRHRIREEVPGARLLLVGDFEEGDPISPETRDGIDDDPAIVRTGFVPDTSPYYGLMDAVALPSYREGFPNVALEAAAAGLPVAGYEATGTVDAVVDGETGTLVPVGDVSALGRACSRYLSDPEIRESHGAAARRRACDLYRSEIVWRAWAEEYERLLETRT